MAQFHWDPDSYLALMREEMPAYDELQQHVAAAGGAGAASILESGRARGRPGCACSRAIRRPA